MAVQAPVMLFDEPLNHLDVPHQQSWLRWLRSRLQAGAAALTVMHELNQAMAADQLLVMQSGKVLHQGAPADEKTRQALQEAFGQCLDFHALDTNGTAPRWVVLPRTDS
jgi:iron complex transport system ATP-binding protein